MNRIIKLLSSIFFFCWVKAARAQGAPQAVLEQITALKAYIITAEQGSKIAAQGLSSIRNIRNSEFELHRVYFSSLSTVNPAVKNMPQILEIINLQESFIKQFTMGLTRWQVSPWLHAQELESLGSFYKTLVEFGVGNINKLRKLLTDKDYKMTDGERIESIQQCQEIIINQDQLVEKLIASTDWVIIARRESYSVNEMVKKMHGTP